VLAFSRSLQQAFAMAFSYKPVDRDQLFLLPPDMRQWLPEDHLAFFVLDLVERIDTSALHSSHANSGAGRQAYDPDMLLSLLLYAYVTGERSSRRVERLCVTDVAFRVVTANHRPDHTTIARFRSGNAAAVAALFIEVLRLCHEAGLVSMGVIAIDGTRMKANASRKANHSEQHIVAEVEKILAEAAGTDAAEDAVHGERCGDELPERFADPRRRKAHLDAALESLRAKQAKRKAAEQAAARLAEEKKGGQHVGAPGRPRKGSASLESLEADLAAAHAANEARRVEWRQRRGAARANGEPDPPRPSNSRRTRARRRLAAFMAAPPAPAPGPSRPPTVNVTDPDSQLMKSPSGWLQGYNAQAAVNDKGIIVSARVTTSHADVEQCQPMMQATQEDLDAAGVDGPIGTLLFDAGYCSDANLTAPGPDRLIATAKSWKLRRQAREQGFAEGEPPQDASPTLQMEHRLRTKEGEALYGLRQTLVEPTFGDVKENLGYRHFVRRGLDACDAEWKLICAAKNIAKLFRATRAGVSPA
jgi:transposase